MSTKSTILNLRLDPDDKAWLESQVEELGLDNVSAVMRSLIRRARKGTLGASDFPRQLAVGMTEAEEQVRRERAEREAARQAKLGELRAQLAALEGGEDDPVRGEQDDPYAEKDLQERIAAEDDFEVPPDGDEPEFRPLPTGFKPPGSVTRPAGASNGLSADRSPAGESLRRNFHHLMPR